MGRVLQGALNSFQHQNLGTVGEITEVLLKAGINPLKYMSKVPEAFLAASSIENFPIPFNIKEIEPYAFVLSNLNQILIHSSITEVGRSCFATCGDLKKVVVLGSSYIGSEAFSVCDSLKRVYLPKTLRGLGEHVFKRCASLKSVDYAGTKEDWHKVSIHMNTFEDSSVEEIKCTDGVIQINTLK